MIAPMPQVRDNVHSAGCYRRINSRQGDQDPDVKQKGFLFHDKPPAACTLSCLLHQYFPHKWIIEYRLLVKYFISLLNAKLLIRKQLLASGFQPRRLNQIKLDEHLRDKVQSHHFSTHKIIMRTRDMYRCA